MRTEKPLTKHDKREVKNFQRFLAFWPKYKLRMLTRPIWQRYLHLSNVEAWKYAKAVSRKEQSK
jgi:hypothetical protein